MILSSILALFAALTFKTPLDPALDWHDCADSPLLEGRGFPGQGNPFHRVPESQKPRMSERAWELSQTSIGFLVRFTTDSDTLAVRWEFPEYVSALPYMSMIAHCGIDIYARRPNEKNWRHVNGGVSAGGNRNCFSGSVKLKWRPGDEAMIYLPMRTGPKSFAIGLKKGATFEKARPHIVDKPVVIYGTSIVNGGIVSRPSSAFPSVMGRLADVEVVNLGFSGVGFMELPMADLVADVDASLYILDCLPNMNVARVEKNYEPFLRQLRKRRPDTPIILSGRCWIEKNPLDCEKAMVKIYNRLLKEEPGLMKNVYYIPGPDMLPHTDDCLADQSHPNDWGQNHLGRFYSEKILEILKP